MDKVARKIAISALAWLAAGCNVGPKYQAPAPPTAPSFKEAAPDEYKSLPPGSWEPANPKDAEIKGKWWEMFGEPELNSLEEKLIIDNQNIAQYYQNFMAARAQVREARAGYFPSVTVDPAVTRSRNGGGAAAYGAASGASNAGLASGPAAAASSAATGARTYSDFSLPFDVSWQPDLWGRLSNTLHAQRFAAQVSASDLENEKLSEQGSLAVYYFELRGQDSLQQLYAQTIAAYRTSLELTRALVETGIESPEDVAEAEVTLRNAEATATGVETNRDIYEHAIATLVGTPASSFSMPMKPLTTPVPAIPVGVPSQLLERRPDIAAAERTMRQANAQIGVEKAAYYPSLSLTGSAGLESSIITKLFSLPALFWSLGGSASQILFDAGLRSATVAQYTATYNADVAAYKQTVLTAFQQVEDYIATLRVTSSQIVRQEAAVRAAQSYVEIATARYQTGLDPYLNVITAQTSLLTAQQTLATLRTSEMTAAVQLVQALGGGWNQSQLPGT